MFVQGTSNKKSWRRNMQMNHRQDLQCGLKCFPAIGSLRLQRSPRWENIWLVVWVKATATCSASLHAVKWVEPSKNVAGSVPSCSCIHKYGIRKVLGLTYTQTSFFSTHTELSISCNKKFPTSVITKSSISVKRILDHPPNSCKPKYFFNVTYTCNNIMIQHYIDNHALRLCH